MKNIKIIAFLVVLIFTLEQVTWAASPGFSKSPKTATQLRTKAASISIGDELTYSIGSRSIASGRQHGWLAAKLKKILYSTIIMLSLTLGFFVPYRAIAQEFFVDQHPNHPIFETRTSQLQQSSLTYIRQENNSFYLYRNGIRIAPSIGMVYQPVPGGRHINDYKDNLASLYKALLDEAEGGQEHARRLYNMGVRSIRVYELDSNSPDDVAKLKEIFRRIHEKYNISVLVGSYAGLFDNIDYKRVDDIKEAILLLQGTVRNFCKEPWVLGWVVGNENNLHLVYPGSVQLTRKFLPGINLNHETYYSLMDIFAGAIKATLEAENVHQIVVLGNGDLSDSEINFISRMRNIDALGINCYRDPEGTRQLIENARRNLTIPLFFTEIGSAAVMPRQEKQQANYIHNILDVIYAHVPGASRERNVIGAFVCEATDQRWKISDTGETEEGFLGVFGKKSEKTIADFSRQLIPLRRHFISRDSSEHFITEAWDRLLSYDYIGARKTAQRCISIYYDEAVRQQKVYSSLPHTPRTKEEIMRFWALNDVATAYYIVGRSWYEINMKPEAKEAFDIILEKFPNSHVMDTAGKYWKLTDAVKKIFPDLYAPKIMLPVHKIGSLALIGTILITCLHTIKSFLKNKKTDLKNKIKNIDISTLREKLTYSGLVFISLFALGYLASWWFHPVRMHYYIVNPALFWLLSYIAIFVIVIYILSWYALSTMERPVHIPASSGKKVAMVTTYVPADSIDLLEDTLRMMVQVQYPHDTYVLDEANDPELKKICDKLGVIHFSRRGIPEFNTQSGKFKTKHKAGNLNSWIYTFGSKYEFVTFLDPDHQPRPEYLDRVLGYFKNSEIGFVQAPQIYRNQKESWIARGAAEQSYYFYGPLLTGYFGQNSTMINGSHNTIRMKALFDIDGYAVHNADDMLTSLKMLSKKWKGVYIPEVLAEGLAPADWSAYLKQQLRWSHSMFDLLFYHYPKYVFKIKFQQFFPYLICGLYYFTAVNFLIMLLTPIISITINQPPINLEFVRFLGIYIPALLSMYIILIGWGQRYLIKPESESGVWWRGGFLAIAASPYITAAFIRAIFKKTYPRPTTPKTTEEGVSYLKLFIPHIIILAGSIFALARAFIIDPIVWQTKGMKLFLYISIVSLTGLVVTSTKWFSKFYTCWKQNHEDAEDEEKGRLRRLIQRIQFQCTGIMDTNYDLNPRFQTTYQLAFDSCS
jgi:cellulose synthase (UDP-forming)